MKHIIKTKEPKVLLDFKNTYKKNHGVDATYNEITHNVKEELKKNLLKEQYSICCYCMNSIDESNSHIEHIKPQSQFQTETLDHDNLLVSCNGFWGNKANCGHNKDNWYDAKEFLTPLDPDCESIFTYSINGEMDATQNNGKTTIAKLNLNSHLLVRARKMAITISGLFEDDFVRKKQTIIDDYSNPNFNKEYHAFCMAVIYCVNNFGVTEQSQACGGVLG